MAHHVDARYDGRDSMFLPPLRTIGFNPQLQMNDSLLALSYVEAYDISYPEALNRIADEVTEMRQTLENSGKFELNDIGTIILNEDGNYTFEPCEAGILTPELYGLGGLNMLPLAQISAEEAQKTEDSAASIIEMPAKTVENNRKESKVKNQDSNQKMESGLSVNSSVFVNDEDEKNQMPNLSASRRAGCAILQQPASLSLHSSPTLLHWEHQPFRRAKSTQVC